MKLIIGAVLAGLVLMASPAWVQMCAALLAAAAFFLNGWRSAISRHD